MSISRLLAAVIILWSSFYSVSYGTWTWKKKNKLGAVMVFILALASIALPIYSFYFRKV